MYLVLLWKTGFFCNVECCLVVTKELRRKLHKHPKRCKKWSNPNKFACNCSHSSIFSFCGRTRHYSLFLCLPRNRRSIESIKISYQYVLWEDMLPNLSHSRKQLVNLNHFSQANLVLGYLWDNIEHAVLTACVLPWGSAWIVIEYAQNNSSLVWWMSNK